MQIDDTLNPKMSCHYKLSNEDKCIRNICTRMRYRLLPFIKNVKVMNAPLNIKKKYLARDTILY